MITLFVIVVIATLVLAVMRAEGMRPLGLALVGMISLVLGARATAVFTETSIAPLLNAVVFAQDESPAADSAVATSDVEDADTGSPETSSATPEIDETPAAEPDTESATTDTDAATVPPVPSAEADSKAKISSDPKVLTKPITVETVTNVDYLDRKDAPSWLETKPRTENGVYTVPVASRLQISEADRDSALTEEINKATNAYINEFLKNKHATTLLKLRSIKCRPSVGKPFNERVVVTAGTMYQGHALVSFNNDFRDAISAEWSEVRAASRLMQTGLGAGVVILLLSTMFSYFRLDTATRGYYTGRLQFAAAAAILAVIAVGVLFANYVPWM